MSKPLMQHGTAVWLIENTSLSFEQIADFCQLHHLEVEHLANSNHSYPAENPINLFQLTMDEIERCQKDPKLKLKILESPDSYRKSARRTSKYTPLAKRQARPHAILWILKHHPEVPDAQIISLLGTTKTTINSVRTKAHWNYANLEPKSPVHYGLCTLGQWQQIIEAAGMQKKAEQENEEM